MQRVEQHVIARTERRYRPIDALAFASNNLWNLANSQVRQSFLLQQSYLKNAALFPVLKETEAYRARPAKVANHVLLPLHHAWTAIFPALDAYRAYPARVHGTTQAPQVPAQNAGAQPAGL